MKILVTGGAGFIGSNLVNGLINRNHDVVVLDNLSHGKKENVNKKAKLIVGDVKIENDVRKAIKDCEVVFHLAAQTDARSSDEDAVFQTNFLGSKTVFEQAKKIGAKIIFTSSAAVYGNTSPASENSECKPISIYGKSKLKAEKLLDGQSFVTRIFNVYGKDSSSVVTKFSKKIIGFEDITVYGNGLQTRDYVHISDVIAALLLGIEKKGLYNIGTGKETSVLRIIDIISTLSKTKAHVKFSAPIEGEIKRSKANIDKIKKEIKWEPKIGIEEGISALVPSQPSF